MSLFYVKTRCFSIAQKDPEKKHRQHKKTWKMSVNKIEIFIYTINLLFTESYILDYIYNISFSLCGAIPHFQPSLPSSLFCISYLLIPFINHARITNVYLTYSGKKNTTAEFKWKEMTVWKNKSESALLDFKSGNSFISIFKSVKRYIHILSFF